MVPQSLNEMLNVRPIVPFEENKERDEKRFLIRLKTYMLNCLHGQLTRKIQAELFVRPNRNS